MSVWTAYLNPFLLTVSPFPTSLTSTFNRSVIRTCTTPRTLTYTTSSIDHELSLVSADSQTSIRDNLPSAAGLHASWPWLVTKSKTVSKNGKLKIGNIWYSAELQLNWKNAIQNRSALPKKRRVHLLHEFCNTSQIRQTAITASAWL